MLMEYVQRFALNYHPNVGKYTLLGAYGSSRDVPVMFALAPSGQAVGILQIWIPSWCSWDDQQKPGFQYEMV